MCCWVHGPLYCVGWFLECLCICFCNKIISGGNCHFGGWCVDCKVGIFLFENVIFTIFAKVPSIFEIEDLYDWAVVIQGASQKRLDHFR